MPAPAATHRPSPSAVHQQAGQSKPETPPSAPPLRPQPSPSAMAAAATIIGNSPAPQFAEYVHDLQLPSRGIPYVDATGALLLPEGTCKVRSLTGEEEAVLNSPQFNAQAKMSRVIDACASLITPSGQRMDSRDLLSTDRLILLLIIRSVSLGDTYKMDCVCDSCDAKFEHSMSLIRDMDVKNMPRMIPDADGVPREYRYDPINGIACALPMSKKNVTLRLLTGRDEDFLTREVAKGTQSTFLAKNVKGDPSYYFRMMLSIRAIEGRAFDHSSALDMNMLCQFVRALPMRDTARIAKTYEKYDVGIPTEFPVPCPTCGKAVAVSLRMTADFFRPTDDE